VISSKQVIIMLYLTFKAYKKIFCNGSKIFGLDFFRKNNRKSFAKSALSYGFLLIAASITFQISSAADLPTDGQVINGSADIHQIGNALNITQNSQNLVTDWQSFSIGHGYTVNFIQPSASSIALNRVIGSDVSLIQGSLNANGQVFLINPNGILFTQDAQVNVGGLIASTLNLSNENFLAGKYSFEGASSNAVINHGNIQTTNGGTVALIAATIVNDGNITAADGGNVLMGAGSKVTLDLGGPVKLKVEEGLINTLIEQGGAIRADGGTILLTAKASGEVTTSVINHSGVSQARTLANGQKGEILLLGDMDHGTTNVAGKLDASAPIKGDGGFIETSAANVNIAQGTKITAESKNGKGGSWLIDPYNYVIDAAAAGSIVAALNTGATVNISSDGYVMLNSDIIKTGGGDAILTLHAKDSIILNALIKSTNNKLNLSFDADTDRNGNGAIIAYKDISTNGGNLNFGEGGSLDIPLVNGEVVNKDRPSGGGLYVGGNSAVTFDTGGGNINFKGDILVANNAGFNVNTHNGDAKFYELINSGNNYEKVSYTGNWTEARNDAKSGVGNEVGDTYLATPTSRLENTIIEYNANYASSWLGGKRVAGSDMWRWTEGPEGLQNDGSGLAFYQQPGNAAIGYSHWQYGEPNNNMDAGQPDAAVQIGDTTWKWIDSAITTTTLPSYVKETNLGTSTLRVDTGSGTHTFAKEGEIGALKEINIEIASVPTVVPPVVPPVVTPVEPETNDIPRESAKSITQTSFSPNKDSDLSSGQYFGNNVQDRTLGIAENSNLKIGEMQIVKIASQAIKEFNAEKKEKEFDANGITKLFVIDGGIRL
jgi:filamentous hemagglutinin family protein